MRLTTRKTEFDPFEKLDLIRDAAGQATTTGLDRETLSRFVDADASLGRVIGEAWDQWQALQEEFGELLKLDEDAQIRALQAGLVNFYRGDAVNPYVALAARGPWVVTTAGAVVHDSGGYGMLGMGHGPDPVLNAMNQPHVMANVMTASFSQYRFVDAMRREIGHRRGGCPFTGFICLNSGSESVTVAGRLADVNAKHMTDPGGRHAGKPIRGVALCGAFHGRTERPARYSDSTLKTYRKHLASFRDNGRLITVEPNDLEQLAEVFRRADSEGFFIESMFMEPVMGEGNPGMAVKRDFYDLARKLTAKHGSILLMDSIQAGLRTHGCLSVVDYPGFEDSEAPDLETYSKALNAGQYPLSVLAMNERAVNLYRTGVYGNTMTANPRSLDVACAVLQMVTPGLRRNIRDRGAELVKKLRQLASELDGSIVGVQGTGLLVSCELDPQRFASYGAASVEEYMRRNGVGVIHGGVNALRYTPHFNIGSEEIDLIVAMTRKALVEGPRLA